MPKNITGTELYTNGPIERPVTSDKGNTDVFQVLEVFMERLATHTHSGADSKEISLNIVKEEQEFISPSWEDQGEGKYRFLVPITPAPSTWDSQRFFYAKNSGGTYDQIFPTTERITDTSYYIYINQNNVDIKVISV